MVLIIMTITGWKEWLIDVKARFLKWEHENNKEIYMEIPEDVKKFYPQQDYWLQINKAIYGLK